jgi:trans-aconitate methyltransferase
MVEAYKYRAPYPDEVFDILASLIPTGPRRVLDVGCGTGEIARSLVSRVEWVDAVDFSEAMLEEARRLPHGDDPRIHWIYGKVEEVALDPPYALITAGASLHWMEWSSVLPRFSRLLTQGGYLAIIEQETTPSPWDHNMRELVQRYSTNKEFQAYDLVEELEKRGLFERIGEKRTQPMPFVESVDDYIESYHSRNGFSKDWMPVGDARAFDAEAKQRLMAIYPNGTISFEVAGTIAWGIPKIV